MHADTVDTDRGGAHGYWIVRWSGLAATHHCWQAAACHVYTQKRDTEPVPLSRKTQDAHPLLKLYCPKLSIGCHHAASACRASTNITPKPPQHCSLMSLGSPYNPGQESAEWWMLVQRLSICSPQHVEPTAYRRAHQSRSQHPKSDPRSQASPVRGCQPPPWWALA